MCVLSPGVLLVMSADVCRAAGLLLMSCVLLLVS